MNIKEWKLVCENNTADHTWDCKSRAIQKSLVYNSNPEATTRHHLMDTPEQIAYNKEYYEMWGFDLDGTFEYGKYIIFCTEEEHRSIWHNVSGEKNPMYGKHHSKETLEKLKTLNKHKVSEETKRKHSENAKGEKNPMYGKHHSDETKQKISESLSGESHPMYGKHYTEDHNLKISLALTGKEFSEEHKQHLREAWLTRAPDSDETHMKKSVAAKNRVQSDEEKLKRSLALKGKKKSEEHKQHLREVWKRKKELLLQSENRCDGDGAV
jgi:hypothetical protein